MIAEKKNTLDMLMVFQVRNVEAPLVMTIRASIVKLIALRIATSEVFDCIVLL